MRDAFGAGDKSTHVSSRLSFFAAQNADSLLVSCNLRAAFRWGTPSLTLTFTSADALRSINLIFMLPSFLLAFVSLRYNRTPSTTSSANVFIHVDLFFLFQMVRASQNSHAACFFNIRFGLCFARFLRNLRRFSSEVGNILAFNFFWKFFGGKPLVYHQSNLLPSASNHSRACAIARTLQQISAPLKQSALFLVKSAATTDRQG